MLKSVVLKYFLKLLHARRMQVWYENLVSPENMFGADPTAGKLWNQFKRDLRPFTQYWFLTQWIKLRTIGVRAQARTIKPIRPAKKFLITLTNLPPSVQSAERCIESAKRHGEAYNLEIVPGTNKFESHDFFIRHGLAWNKEYAETTDPYAGMGCFASHYNLWRRCVEIGKPVMILEHDSVFVDSIPELRFRHVIMLGKPYFFNHIVSKISRDKKREIFHPWRFLRGTHCYAITPEGAQTLLEKAPRQLLPPVDLFMNKKNVDILYYHPPPVDLDVRFSSVANKEARILLQQGETSVKTSFN